MKKLLLTKSRGLLLLRFYEKDFLVWEKAFENLDGVIDFWLANPAYGNSLGVIGDIHETEADDLHL